MTDRSEQRVQVSGANAAAANRVTPSTGGGLERPALTLPKGGGAIRGIDEKFSVNPATGTGSFSIPIATSPGRSGFGPDLSLGYDSGAGNGPFGLGWSLSVPSISRKTDKGLPQYRDGEDGDVFLLTGAEDLVPALLQAGDDWIGDVAERQSDGESYSVFRYRPRIEARFDRIERWQHQTTGISHWRSVSRDNLVSTFGRNAASRVADPDEPSRVFRWLLEEIQDAKGNVIRYEYKSENLDNVEAHLPREKNRLAMGSLPANRYLKRVFYGNRQPHQTDEWLFEVVFDYGEHDPIHPSTAEQQPWPVREDPFSSYRAGFEIRGYRLCRRVLMFHHFPELGETPYLVSATEFGFREQPVLSLLTSVGRTGYARRDDGSPVSKSMPPLELGYGEAVLGEELQVLDEESLANLPAGLAEPGTQWVDLDGEGISGILTERAGSWYFKAGLGNVGAVPASADAISGPPEPFVAARPRFAACRSVWEQPAAVGSGSGDHRLMDLAGDGSLDLVQLGPSLKGFYERDGQEGWRCFKPFETVPNLDWSDPHLRMIDLTGEGHADILISENDAFVWYVSRGEEGFGPSRRVVMALEEERGPTLVLADGEQSVYLADMSGDGLTDIVRIRNGDICYWPNLGYGRFGAKVTMDGAPQFDHLDQFERRRIRLADIDGSGTSDMLYLGRGGVSIWFNQAGNGWSEPHRLQSFPGFDQLGDVRVLDLLGNGTACLVWSSPLPGDSSRPFRFVDLMNGQKPHLLNSIINNMGAETRLSYAPSTRFFLQDRAQGRPWLTRLPFPVHVVERVEVRDWVADTKFVSLYRYHHGYFDEIEREFRGFGLVEQWDSETFSAFKGRGLFPEDPANADEELHAAPVYTKTWFHAGVYQSSASISQQLKHEYYREPGISDAQADALLLPDTVPPPGLGLEETRQAVRALKGAVLRQEIYGLDGSDESRHPYTVSERAYAIQSLQPLQGGRHAVFHVHDSQSLDFHYERRPEDPRVIQRMTLALDEMGMVTDRVAIAYPRRAPEFPEQAELKITWSKNDWINRVDQEAFYLVGLPYQKRNYEISGIEWFWSDPVTWLNGETFAPVIADPADFRPYHWRRPEDHVGIEKRLLQWSRSYYRGDAEAHALDEEDDLAHRLPLGEAEALALPYEGYSAAFSDELLQEAFDGRISEAMLSEGRYHIEPDVSGTWWLPLGRQGFDQNQFFLPTHMRDPFGNISSMEYEHGLLVRRITDPVGNSVQAEIDFRVLQPRMVTGANGNRSQAAFDALGMVVGSAVLGKVEEAVGDSLEGFDPFLDAGTIAAHLADPLGDPLATLQGATTRLIYDADRYRRTRQVDENGRESGEPAVVYSLSRERHDGELGEGQETRVQHGFLYSDGLGREAQRKVGAEPDTDAGGDPPPRWVGTGRTVFDNKGNPVKKYEPFFSNTHSYEREQDLVETGVTPLLRYDALGRLIRSDFPNGTFRMVEFDPWRELSWDANDTVLESLWYSERGAPDPGQVPAPTDPETRAAYLAAGHAGTPLATQLDCLGRSFLRVADNGPAGPHETRFTLDIEGNALIITDARGNPIESSLFDIAGRLLRKDSADAGTRWQVDDVGGNPLRAWDSRDHMFRTTYDALRRPVSRFMRPGNQPEILFERTVYGELHPEAAARNLRGRVYQLFDGAGVETSERYDFKGNLQSGTRRLAAEYRQVVDWSGLAGTGDVTEIAALAGPLLEAESFSTSADYDALNRVIRFSYPDGSEVLPVFNQANLLESLDVRPRGITLRRFVENIDYDAKGQRRRIEHGNGMHTEYEYDPLTFRLIQLQTLRSLEPTQLQSLTYTYDPSGNITEVRDEAQQTIFFDNGVVDASNRYEYDALYRLVHAEGREHAGQNAASQRDHGDIPRLSLPHANDANALRRYSESYEYDGVGNLERLIHGFNGGSWTRHYQYAPHNNQLLATSLPGDDPLGPFSGVYQHDAHGNMTRLPHLPAIQWDFKDQKHEVDLGGGGEVFFVYDGRGQRVRKVHEHNGATVEQRIYLEGFEIYRRHVNGELRTERETLHVMDDSRRVAMVETLTVDEGAEVVVPSARERYQLGNHLGSAALEVDETGAVISYEEYHPFGATAYHGTRNGMEVSQRRYRYTGKERDEETGLYYHGARYYAPWLGRWTAADPLGLAGGLNLYEYVRSNPIRLIDPDGMAPAGPRPKLPGKRHPIAERVLRSKLKDVVVDPSAGTGDIEREDPPHVQDEKDLKDGKVNRAEGAAQGEIRGEADSPGSETRTEAKTKPTKAGGLTEAPRPASVMTDTATHGGDRIPFRVEPAPHPKRPVTFGAIQHQSSSVMVGGPNPRRTARGFSRIGRGLRIFGAAVPFAGAALGHASAAHAAAEGNYTDAALDEFGNIPLVGDVLDVGRAAYEITSGVDEILGVSDAASKTIGDLTGQSAELQRLDAIHGGRTNRRGSPGFLKPRVPRLTLRKAATLRGGKARRNIDFLPMDFGPLDRDSGFRRQGFGIRVRF